MTVPSLLLTPPGSDNKTLSVLNFEDKDFNLEFAPVADTVMTNANKTNKHKMIARDMMRKGKEKVE